MTKILLDAGMDVNALDKEGRTPLHSVAVISWEGPKTIATAELLLENGVDSQAKDAKGMTALDYAKEKKKGGLIKLLESYSGK
jgi:ankyrin repeat protein